MNIVSLTTARKLKEAGYPLLRDCYFDWPSLYEDNVLPCACEILEQLPQEIPPYNFKLSRLTICNLWCVGYEVRDEWHIKFSNESLDEACAELYLWCKQEGYIK